MYFLTLFALTLQSACGLEVNLMQCHPFVSSIQWDNGTLSLNPKPNWKKWTHKVIDFKPVKLEYQWLHRTQETVSIMTVWSWPCFCQGLLWLGSHLRLYPGVLFLFVIILFSEWYICHTSVYKLFALVSVFDINCLGLVSPGLLVERDCQCERYN